jgi:IS5 family transposase
VIERQFRSVKVCYMGLAKSIAKLQTLFTLANLWQVRRKPLGAVE